MSLPPRQTAAPTDLAARSAVVVPANRPKYPRAISIVGVQRSYRYRPLSTPDRAWGPTGLQHRVSIAPEATSGVLQPKRKDASWTGGVSQRPFLAFLSKRVRRDEPNELRRRSRADSVLLSSLTD